MEQFVISSTQRREAPAKGPPVYGESLHHDMFFTHDDYKRPYGQIYHTYPALKTTVLDPSPRGKVQAAELHQTDDTPWEGHEIFAWPVLTMLRGVFKVKNGKYLGKPGDGRHLTRKIPSENITGVAL